MRSFKFLALAALSSALCVQLALADTQVLDTRIGKLTLENGFPSQDTVGPCRDKAGSRTSDLWSYAAILRQKLEAE